MMILAAAALVCAIFMLLWVLGIRQARRDYGDGWDTWDDGSMIRWKERRKK